MTVDFHAGPNDEVREFLSVKFHNYGKFNAKSENSKAEMKSFRAECPGIPARKHGMDPDSG